MDVCAARIALAAPPASRTSDLFAAHMLGKALMQACGRSFPVLTGTATVHASAVTPQILLVDENRPVSFPNTASSQPENGNEAYKLTISSARVELRANTSTGLFYGVQTLLQLLEPASIHTAAALPEVTIEDWPAMPYRGLMLDTSHGAMPTMEAMHQLLDALAAWKINQFYLYAETNLPLTHPAPPNHGNQWTRAEIQDLVGYAQKRHIDVIPCVEFYGHLHDLLATEHESALGAMRHGGELNPTLPAAQALVASWMRQIVALFPSPWIHIGFDEPFELDHMDAESRKGLAPDTIWAEHLRKTAALAQSLGKRPIFWADIDEGAFLFNKYPQLAASLPAGAVAAPWFYDARTDYSSLLAPFHKHQVSILVTPAVSDWDDIAPDYKTSFINIDGMAQAGRKVGALGLINTLWSDSALPLHRAALPGVAFGAAAAWEADPVDQTDFFLRYAQLTLPPAAAQSAAVVYEKLAQAETLLKDSLGSEPTFRLFDDPFEAGFLKRARQHSADLRAVRMDVEDAQQAFQELAGTGRNDPTLASLATLADIVDYSAMRALYAVEIEDNFHNLPEHPSLDDIRFWLARETAARNHSRVQDLIDNSGICKEEYRASWLEEYRPFRLTTAMARWSREQEFWIGFQEKVWRAEHEFQPGDEKPSLDKILAEPR